MIRLLTRVLCVTFCRHFLSVDWVHPKFDTHIEAIKSMAHVSESHRHVSGSSHHVRHWIEIMCADSTLFIYIGTYRTNLPNHSVPSFTQPHFWCVNALSPQIIFTHTETHINCHPPTQFQFHFNHQVVRERYTARMPTPTKPAYLPEQFRSVRVSAAGRRDVCTAITIHCGYCRCIKDWIISTSTASDSVECRSSWLCLPARHYYVIFVILRIRWRIW